MHKNQGPVYYGDYLKLDELLGAQIPKSKVHGDECHDETLFIIVHQVYELWFKQILHELNSFKNIFEKKSVEERDLATILSRLDRITKIQRLLIDQLDVMETMTSMDFLEFRDLLIPASGFQSVQFREIEIMMGLSTQTRHNVDRAYFLGRLNKEDQDRLLEAEKRPSLLSLIESWLERLPFTDKEGFKFWQEYEKSVEQMLNDDEELIKKSCTDKTSLEIQLENLKLTRETFKSLLNEDIHNSLVEKGERKLSRQATMNALFIMLYREEPMLYLPYRFLVSLIDIDEHFTSWRHRHAIMAHRLLGTKIGTGGSSGHQYLKTAAEKNRVFLDLFNLSTFIIPKSTLPKLPEKIRKEMNFYFNEQ